jgi:translation initiation factor eIF-2B subunit alpha
MAVSDPIVDVADDDNNDNKDDTYDDESELVPIVLQDLRRFLKRDGRPSSLFDMSVMATPVAAIKALLGVVERSNATTMMELQDELKQAREIVMQDFFKRQQEPWMHSSIVSSAPGGGSGRSGARNMIALASGCDLFLKYATRTFLEHGDFVASRNQVVERGQRFAGISLAARDRIAHIGADFIQEGQTVLTHGWSRVVASILLKAAETKHFDIIFLEGRPDAAGAKAARAYASHESKIPTTVVLDSAMGYVMESVDVVLVGAEAVVENGGFVNKMGTYALATCAKGKNLTNKFSHSHHYVVAIKSPTNLIIYHSTPHIHIHTHTPIAHGKPFYVASESYKFARLYPLNQQDLPVMGNNSPIEFVDTTIAATSQNKDGKESKQQKQQQQQQQDKLFEPVNLPENVRVENSPCDFTPAKFITLLFTDLGVLTPSAVSDELIRLYQ